MGEEFAVKIWVTGSTGSLGTELIQELQVNHNQFEVLCPSRKELNLLDRENVVRFITQNKPTYIIHLAARVFGIAGHRENPNLSFEENSLIDCNIFDGINLAPPEWMYYASTVAAYGFPYKHLPLQEDEFLIGLPHTTELGYALAKRNAIEKLQDLREKNNTKFAYGLMTNLYGIGDKHLEGNGHVVVGLIEKALEAANSNKPLEVWGTGKATRDFLSTTDAAKIICELINVNTGAINIATGQEVSIEFIAKTLSEYLNLKHGFKFTGDNEGLTRRVCSIEKLKEYSNHVISINSEQTLEKYLISSVT